MPCLHCAGNHPSAGNLTVALQQVTASKQEYAIVSNIGDTYDLVNHQVIIGLQSGVMLQKATGESRAVLTYDGAKCSGNYRGTVAQLIRGGR